MPDFSPIQLCKIISQFQCIVLCSPRAGLAFFCLGYVLIQFYYKNFAMGLEELSFIHEVWSQIKSIQLFYTMEILFFVLFLPFFHLYTLEDTSLGMTSIFAHLMSRDTYCLYSILCFQGCLYRTQIWKTKNLPAEHNCPLPPIIKAPSIIKYLGFLRKMFLAYNLIHCVCRCHLSFFVSLSRNRSL